jgi:hypothetical protein
MVRQILSNNNKSATEIFLSKISDLNTAMVFFAMDQTAREGAGRRADQLSKWELRLWVGAKIFLQVSRRNL